MKKKWIFVASIVAVTALLSSCGKECVCTTTYETYTLSRSVESEMGKLTEKECSAYNQSYAESEGVFRTVTCVLK